MTPQIMDLAFEIIHQHRPFEVIAPGFEQVSRPAGRANGWQRTDAVPVAPFAAVELAVDQLPASGVAAGLASDDVDVLVSYDPLAGRAAIEVRRGASTTIVRDATAHLRAPFRLAFVLCENQVTGLADTGSGWWPLLSERTAVSRLVDLRDPAVLSATRFAYGSRNRDEDVDLGPVCAGPFGYTGVRDPHLVQRPDGSALIRDGKAFLTFTCAGMGFFQQAHWGVFTLDLADPGRLEQLAQLYAGRDGLLLGDHAGQLVVDEPRRRTTVVVSSWGDFAHDGVHVRHCTTDADLLSGVHVLYTEPLAVPTAESCWDPSLTRIENRWHLPFVQSPSQDPFTFHPALAVGEPGGQYDQPLRLVGADRDPRECEGTILQRVGGSWYLLASNRDVQEYPVYDLSMRRLGSLAAPYLSNIPHPQVLNLPDGGHLLVTFNGEQYAEEVLGYGGHGDLVVMAAR